MASSEVQRAAGAARPLTHKQEKFAQGVFEHLSHADAYRRAYNAHAMKPSVIYVRAQELLRNSKVADRIAALRALEERAVQREIQRTAVDIARAAWAIIESDDTPPTAKVAALNLESKRYREYSDKQEHSGPGGGPLQIEAILAALTPEQLAKAIAELTRLADGG